MVHEELERPDQTCHLCKQPITDDKWTDISEKAYHNDCMECVKCQKRVGFEKFIHRKNVAICPECDAEKTSEKPAPFAASQWHDDSHHGRQCSVCKSTAPGSRLLRAGKYYCQRCYRCFHCEQVMGTENCLTLLDRIYCFGCEKEFNAQRFFLGKYGSGPLVLSFL